MVLVVFERGGGLVTRRQVRTGDVRMEGSGKVRQPVKHKEAGHLLRPALRCPAHLAAVTLLGKPLIYEAVLRYSITQRESRPRRAVHDIAKINLMHRWLPSRKI